MSTQSRNLYDKNEIDAIRQEFGVSVGESMNAAIEDTKDAIEEAATSVASVVEKVDHRVVYYVMGVITGMAAVVIARFI